MKLYRMKGQMVVIYNQWISLHLSCIHRVGDCIFSSFLPTGSIPVCQLCKCEVYWERSSNGWIYI